jgi:hypothetical protein
LQAPNKTKQIEGHLNPQKRDKIKNRKKNQTREKKPMTTLKNFKTDPNKETLLDHLAARLLRNLPTLYFENQKEIKLIPPEQIWCLNQLRILQTQTLEELKLHCKNSTPNTLFFLNPNHLSPRKLFEALKTDIPNTLIIPHTSPQ